MTVAVRGRSRSAGTLPSVATGGLWAAACGAALIAAALLRAVIPTNEDVSWLIELAQRVLSGARFYADFFEVNPPASILVYVPAAALARLTGLAPEHVTDALMFAGCAASLAACGWSLRRADMMLARPGPFALGALLILLALPVYTFAEREHVAVLAMLPALTTLAIRCRTGRIDPWSIAMAGIGVGCAVAIKPFFALALVGPAACVLLARNWQSVARSGELWIGAMLAAAYGLAVVLLVPAFAAQVMPVVLAVYVPNRVPLPLLMTSPVLLVWFGTVLMVGWGAMRHRPHPLVPVLATASAGFVVVFLLQGKGFAYHGYPAVALAMLAVLVSIADDPPVQEATAGSIRRLGPVQWCFLVLAGLAGANFFDRHYDPDDWTPGLREAVQAVAPHPTVIAFSQQLALGQPFTRAAGGVWVGSAASTWVTGNAESLIERGADPESFQPWIRREQAMYASDIENRRPDVVLVAGDRWQELIDRSPALTHAMAAYERRARYGAVAMWVRTRDRAGAGGRNP